MFKTILLVFYILARLYQVIIGFAMVLTWFPRSSENLFFRFVSAAGDCYLGPFRGLIGLAGIDFGPLIALGIYEAIISFAFSL
ncbi:MAG TPA: YggT family protein [Acholeplasmataceae bacterium]|jgi:uncharacterized protein YggT (Ycf19 family)|nr:YggT family protein [Acholeplasmataceae bacterium]